MKRIFIAVFLLVIIVVFFTFRIRADINSDIQNLGQQITALNQQKNLTQSDYDAAIKKLNDIKNQIVQVQTAITQKEEEVRKGEQALEYQKNLLNQRVGSYYKNVNKDQNIFLNILVSNNLSASLREIFYQKSVVDEDKTTIVKTVLYIKNLEEIKANLTQQKADLAALKDQVDKKSQQLAGTITNLNSQISSLVAQQQSLIAQRLAALNLPQSAYTSTSGCSSDLTNGKNPGFSPGFGFFTFGVPHRVGMSQYGAWGRAKANQNEETILHAYYNFDEFRNVDTNIQIKVNDSNGFNSGNIIWSGSLENYMKRIYEIPASWTENNSAALKAQAIAVRSYVLASTNNGASSICANQHCQVFQDKEKTDNGNAWINAVNDTQGKVMIKDGNPISAYFSSTAGGYTHDSSNDISSRPWTKNTQDGDGPYSSFSDIQNNAFDGPKHANSPWFYCDWGGRSAYGNTAWLKSEEVADIANVILLVQKDPSTIGNVYQVDASNPTGKETWDANRVKQELRNRGGNPFNSVSSVNISADFGSGRTTSVTVSGDAGTQSFSGGDFKTYFDQRAPGNIQIVGPLFNVEKR